VTRLTNLVTQSTAISSLTECQSLLASLIESIADAVFVKDLQGRYVLVNRMAAAILNKPMAAIIGRTAVELMLEAYSPEYAAEVLAEDRQLLIGGAPLTVEREVLVHGTWRCYQAIKSVWRDAQGQPLGIISIDRDITAQKQAEIAGRESEERFATFFHHSPYPIAILSFATQRYVDVNPTWVRDTGYTQAEAIGRTPAELNLQAEPQLQLFSRLRQEGAVRDVEIQVRVRNAQVHTALMSAELIQINRTPHALLVFTNITERKQAEAALQASESQLRLVTDNVSGLISYVDQTQCYRFVNAVYEQWFAQPRTQIMGHSVHEILGATAYAAAQPHIREALAGERVTFENTITYPDTITRTVLTTYVPDVGGDGQILGFYALVTDISERKQAEERLRFLAEASTILASSLDYSLTLQNVARAAVPGIADWCVIHLREDDGSIRGAVIAHVDPAKVQWAEELQQRYPIDMNAPRGTPNVMRTRQSEFYPEITDAMLQAVAKNAEELQLLRSVGYRSVMIVPLQTHGRILGVITFVATDSERHFTPADLTMAEELAQRAAAAIGNAQLHHAVQQREQQLRVSEERLRLATEAGRIGIYDHDLLTHHTTYSPIYRAITGIEANEQLTRAAWLMRVHPDDRALVAEKLERSVTYGESYDYEYRIYRPDGELRWLGISNRVSVDESGRAVRLTGALSDITARKEAEEEIQRLNRDLKRRFDELQSLLDVAPIGIFVAHDPACTMITSNTVGAKMLGIQPAENASKSGPAAEQLPFRVLRNGRELTPDEMPMQYAATHDVAVNNWEVDVVQADGHVVTLYEYALPLHDEEGNVRGCLGIFVDITERKAAEAALQELTTTLERRVKERTVELERSNQELDQFAYVASHDLRAPLRSIVNLAGWIAEDAADQLPAPSQEHLAKLQGRTLRMERLLDDLLTYSRVGRSDDVVEGVKTDLLLQDVIYLLAPPEGFTMTVIGELPFLLTPRVPLELVFRNLIGNAIKHHHQPTTGIVQISAQDQGDFVEFIISDNGPGIEPQYHKRIFGMFQTLRPRDDVEGSGMGLAIVKRTVEYLGGVIQIESTYGAGTTFRFLWPKQVVIEAKSPEGRN